MTRRNAGPYAQINAGGGAAGTFAPDAYFSGGTTRTTNSVINTNAAGAAPMAVYQSERRGAMTYTIPLPQGTYPYTVKLHFAETDWTAAKQRQFNVSINGAQVLNNFDIYAAAGARNTAVIKSFPTVSDGNGNVAVSFTTGAHDTPVVQGIEVY